MMATAGVKAADQGRSVSGRGSNGEMEGDALTRSEIGGQERMEGRGTGTEIGTDPGFHQTWKGIVAGVDEC